MENFSATSECPRTRMTLRNEEETTHIVTRPLHCEPRDIRRTDAIYAGVGDGPLNQSNGVSAMYFLDKLSSGFEGDGDTRQSVVRPAQRVKFYPLPHSNLSGFGESGGAMSLLPLPKPLLNLDRFAYKGVA